MMQRQLSGLPDFKSAGSQDEEEEEEEDEEEDRQETFFPSAFFLTINSISFFLHPFSCEGDQREGD